MPSVTDIVVCDNFNFDPSVRPYVGEFTAAGQLAIGTGTTPAIAVNTLSSSGGTVTITNGPGTINLEAGSTTPTTFTTNSGNAAPVGNVLNILGSGSTTTTGSGNTVSVVLTGLTNHAVLIGSGTSTITKVGPVASTGAMLQSNGLGSDPGFSTSTWPATTTINQILYSSSANTVAGLTAANSASLVSTSAGVPVWSASMTNGQLIIGSTGATPVAATIGSSDSSITWTLGAGTLTGQVTAGTAVVKTITGNTGGALSPTAGNFNIVGTGSITVAGSGSTETIQLTGITNHALQIGAGTATLTQLGAGTTGQILQTNTTADPTWSTATYPSVATGSGTILRANGTNWLASTSTFADTYSASTLLYSNGANTVTGLATANSSALVTTSSGVPVWSSTMTNGQLIIGSTGATPTAATLTAGSGITITNAAGAITIASGSGSTPGVVNLGVAYSGGTFTVQGANGSALSASNPAYVTLQSKATPGNLVTITVTANQTFTDGSAGTTDNARFGVTTGINWAQDIPFFLYGVMDDTEALINFMFSRTPCSTLSPASTSISKTGSIINVNQADFFSLGNITVTSYDSNPCLCIGSFRMQFVGATDSWTVQALNTTDGIGQFNDNHTFVFPSGQNGAASGTYILSNAGTEPVFTSNGMVYTIQRNGLVKYNFNGQNASTAGVGAQALQPVLPYAISSSNQEDSIYGRHTQAASTSNFHIVVGVPASSSAVSSIYNPSSPTISYLNSTIALADSLQFVAFYRAFTNVGL